MNIGPAEIVIVVVMVLCFLAGPILVLVGFFALLRRIDRVEKDVQALHAKENPPD